MLGEHIEGVLVPGAALEVVAQGGTPVLVDCDEEPLAHMAQRCGPDTLYLTADVTDFCAMQSAVDKTLAVHGRIDVVFANAGVAVFGPLAHVDQGAWKRCMEVNVFGVFNTVR